MRVCVLVKRARDPDAPAGLDAAGYLPEAGTYPMLEPSAFAGLAVARRIAGADGEVVAITVGGADCDVVLRQALEQGSNRALRVQYSRWRHASVASVADALIDGMRSLELEPDLVLCGDRSVDEGAGLLGPLVAHGLSLPWTSGVASVESGDGGGLKLLRRRPRGERLEVRGSLPALLCLDPPLEPAEPAPFGRIAWAADAPIEVYSGFKSFGGAAPRLEAARPKGVPVSVPASSLPPSMRIWSMFWGAEEKRVGVVKELPADQTADDILDVLRQRGVVE